MIRNNMGSSDVINCIIHNNNLWENVCLEQWSTWVQSTELELLSQELVTLSCKQSPLKHHIMTSNKHLEGNSAIRMCISQTASVILPPV